MITEKERAQSDAILDEIAEKKRRLKAFNRIDDNEAKYRAKVLLYHIGRLERKYDCKTLEVIGEDEIESR